MLFTDEPPQTYRAERGLSEESVVSACESLVNGEQLFVFTQPAYAAQWWDCGTLQTRELQLDSALMRADLEAAIAGACQ